MVLVALANVGALTAFAIVGPNVAEHRPSSPCWSCPVGCAVRRDRLLAPNSTEVYPTSLRGRGSGLAAGASELGGVLALGIAVLGIAVLGIAPPALGGAAIIAGGAMLIAGVAIGSVGIETRDAVSRKSVNQRTSWHLAREADAYLIGRGASTTTWAAATVPKRARALQILLLRLWSYPLG